jgi:hypothetical protein
MKTMDVKAEIGVDVYVDFTEGGNLEVAVYSSDGDNEIVTVEFSILELFEDTLSAYTPSDSEDRAYLESFLSEIGYELTKTLDRVHNETMKIATGAYDGR